jgi:hypothetical protein
MTYQTSYLVMGERPASAGVDRPGDRLLERKAAIKARIDELESQAKGMGIQVISARKFLAMIGYPLPRTALEPNFATGGGVIRSGGEGTPPATPPGEPKEEKKPEEKKPPQ